MSIQNLKAAAEYAGNMYRDNPNVTVNIQARFKGILVRGRKEVGGRDVKSERLVTWDDADANTNTNLILIAVQDVEHELHNGGSNKYGRA